MSGSFTENDLGVENPTASANAIHDHTEQTRGFAYLSDILSPDARVSAMLGSSVGFFEIPNNPGQTPNFTALGVSNFPSAALNEQQREVNHYAIVALQVSGDRLDYQIAPFTRYSETKFSPDPLGDLIFNGFADRSQLSSWSSGIQADASYKLTDDHTLRAGLFFSGERTVSQVTSNVFPVDATGAQTTDRPLTVFDQTGKTGYLYGVYLQDEWTISDALTLNFGGRFDVVNAFTDENQVSPKVNLVWKRRRGYEFPSRLCPQFHPASAGTGRHQFGDEILGTTKAPEVLR